MEKIKAGIIGAAGYTAGELIRILVNHPNVEIAFAQSESQAGKPITSIHQDLIGENELKFSSEIDANQADVFFLCKGHGESSKIIENYPDLMTKKIVDLSQDFRLKGNHDFVYGLPEFSMEEIRKANHIANPGCFATCLQLGILAAIEAGVVNSELHISGITGSTGAGQSFSRTSHFSWRNSNASAYKALTHQHLKETGESVLKLDNSFEQEINFIPYRGAFTRGIICTTYFDTDASEEELKKIYTEKYNDAAFTHVIGESPDLKMVVNTNKAVVQVSKVGDKGLVISAIDNLLKGASGQAVQNMNLIFELDEKAGLNLKATAF